MECAEIADNFLHREMQIISRAEKQEFLLHRKSAISLCKQQSNKKKCNCTYPCDKKGMCCECLQYHLARNELPACCFSKSAEKTYDRSFNKFKEDKKLS